MKISVFAFGKLKTPGLRESAEHYLKLIRPWSAIEEIELKPLEVPEKSAAKRKEIQGKEGTLLLERALPRLGSRGVLCLLDEGGKAMPSEEWARLLRAWEDSSVTEAAFCVGGSLGFSPEVRARATLRLSLGPQTLSHMLARVVLYEQLYRALSILRGHPYHHGGM